MRSHQPGYEKPPSKAKKRRQNDDDSDSEGESEEEGWTDVDDEGGEDAETETSGQVEEPAAYGDESMMSGKSNVGSKRKRQPSKKRQKFDGDGLNGGEGNFAGVQSTRDRSRSDAEAVMTLARAAYQAQHGGAGGMGAVGQEGDDVKSVLDPSLENLSAFSQHFSAASSSDLTSPAKVLAGLSNIGASLPSSHPMLAVSTSSSNGASAEAAAVMGLSGMANSGHQLTRGYDGLAGLSDAAIQAAAAAAAAAAAHAASSGGMSGPSPSIEMNVSGMNNGVIAGLSGSTFPSMAAQEQGSKITATQTDNVSNGGVSHAADAEAGGNANGGLANNLSLDQAQLLLDAASGVSSSDM
jgi:hypothetical protein